MRKFIIAKRSAHALRQYLDSLGNANPAQGGYTREEGRAWDRLADKIEESVKDFVKESLAISKRFKGRLADVPEDSPEADAIRETWEDTQVACNEETGAQMIELKMKDEHYQLIKKKWESIERFPGNKQTRKIVISIDEAFESADQAEEESESGESEEKVEASPSR